MRLKGSIETVILAGALLLGAQAHAQDYVVKSLDCAKTVITLTGKLTEINLTADVPDRRRFKPMKDWRRSWTRYSMTRCKHAGVAGSRSQLILR